MGHQRFLSVVLLSSAFLAVAKAAQISEADLLALTKQEVDNESERLFEYVKTTNDGIRLGCKGKVQKGATGKVQALFIEDSACRREVRKLGPVTAKVRNFLNQEEEKYVPLRDFPMYCLERVFHSSSCPPGPPGRPGRDGRNGTIGGPGIPGEPGRNGWSGVDGTPGWKGPPGLKGPPGERGDRGDTGARGEPGIQGPEGPRGRDGVDGAPGAAGPAGEPGETGPNGKNGIDGTDGLDGAIGLPGPSGIDGLPGPDGLPGLSGFAGLDGYTGVNGFDGQNGLDGRPGADGKCCSNDDSDDETCPTEYSFPDDDLGTATPAENSAPQITIGSGEDEAVKTEMKPGFPKPASFWLANNDLMSLQHSSFDFKNKNLNKHLNKNKKGQDLEESQVEINADAVEEPVVVEASKKLSAEPAVPQVGESEKNEEENELLIK